MIVPRIYQQELLNRLRNASCPRFVAVVAPTGVGIRSALEIRLGEIAGEFPTLVVVTHQALALQWAGRLEAAGVEPVVLLSGASAALQLLEERSVPHRGVIVTTNATTRQGLSRRVLSGIEFGLVIHDQPPPAAADKDELVNARARRVVALLDRYDEPWASWSLIYHLTPDSVLNAGVLPIRRFAYQASAQERDLRNAAVDVMTEWSSRFERPSHLVNDSLPGLHSRLLTAVSRLAEHDELAMQIWDLLDRMDNSPLPDSRLAALIRLLQGVASAGTRCVVVAPTTTEAKYIAEHLSELAGTPSVEVTATTVEDRQTVRGSADARNIVVTTTEAAPPTGGWVTGTVLILWESLTDKRQIPDLGLPQPGVTVIELIEHDKVNPSSIAHGSSWPNAGESRPTGQGVHQSQKTSGRPPGGSTARLEGDAGAVSVVTATAKGRRIVGSERQTLARDLVRRYTAGESIRVLASSTGRSYGFVHRVLTEAGVQLRQRGGARRRKKA